MTTTSRGSTFTTSSPRPHANTTRARTRRPRGPRRPVPLHQTLFQVVEMLRRVTDACASRAMHVGTAYCSIECWSSHCFAVGVGGVRGAAPKNATWIEFKGGADGEGLVEVELTLRDNKNRSLKKGSITLARSRTVLFEKIHSPKII